MQQTLCWTYNIADQISFQKMRIITKVAGGIAAAATCICGMNIFVEPVNAQFYGGFNNNNGQSGGNRCRGYDGPGGPCYQGPGGPLYTGPGGPCYAGPGGPCYSGPGGDGSRCNPRCP